MISFIILSVIVVVILISAFLSAMRYESKITFMRRNEILRQIRYELPQRLEFAYQPFHDTFVNVMVIATLCGYALYPVELPAVLATCYFILKLIIFFLAVSIMRHELRIIWIHGVRKIPALCLNRETFKIFNKDIEWKAIQEIIYSEDGDSQSLTVNYISGNTEQIMDHGFDFAVIKDSYEVILPAVEKYWRICSGQIDLKITYQKRAVL